MHIALIKSYTAKPWRSPQTYQLIEAALAERWPVTSLEAGDPERLEQRLRKLEQDAGDGLFVFNIAEYLDEERKVGFLPTMLEEWDIPYLGSGAAAVRLGLDKAATKVKLVAEGIPTPAYFVAEPGANAFASQSEAIGFPLFVKPLGEGGHIGIGEYSIVRSAAELAPALDRIFQRYQQAALVEAYIGGPGMREFSVGIIDGPIRLVLPMEIDFEAMPVATLILSYENAQDDLERIKLVEDRVRRDEIIDLALKTFEAVGARDYSRVDLRMDADGCQVLEINVMPGLGPHSFITEAAKEMHALDYAGLIRTLAEGSMRRQGLL